MKVSSSYFVNKWCYLLWHLLLNFSLLRRSPPPQCWRQFSIIWEEQKIKSNDQSAATWQWYPWLQKGLKQQGCFILSAVYRSLSQVRAYTFSRTVSDGSMHIFRELCVRVCQHSFKYTQPSSDVEPFFYSRLIKPSLSDAKKFE